MTEFERGNIVLLKRPLADFVCVVQWVEGDDVAIRYMDSPKDAGYNVVKRDELIFLAPEQVKELPEDFLGAIDRQREVIFTPKKKKKVTDLDAEKWKDLPPEAIMEILKIAEEDGGGD